MYIEQFLPEFFLFFPLTDKVRGYLDFFSFYVMFFI